jgi:hypothetical protein
MGLSKKIHYPLWLQPYGCSQYQYEIYQN